MNVLIEDSELRVDPKRCSDSDHIGEGGTLEGRSMAIFVDSEAATHARVSAREWALVLVNARKRRAIYDLISESLKTRRVKIEPNGSRTAIYRAMVEYDEASVKGIRGDGNVRGSYVAAGGLEGNASVWSIDSGRLLFLLEGEVPVLSLAWSSSSEYIFFLGLGNGSMVKEYAPGTFLLTGSFQLSVLLWRRVLWRAAQSRSTVLPVSRPSPTILEDKSIIPLARVEDPDAVSTTENAKVIVCGLHWIKTDYSGQVLLISYVHHGLAFWDAVTGKVYNRISSNTPMLLAISNINAGFDIYDLVLGTLLASFTHKVGRKLRIPVLFLHSGGALIGGTTTGNITMWDTKTEAFLQVLEHGDGDTVLALAGPAHLSDQKRPFIVTAGAASRLGTPFIKLWYGYNAHHQADHPEHQADNSQYENRLLSSMSLNEHATESWMDNMLLIALLAALPLTLPIIEALLKGR
ncbi:hypothetical protein CONPUDRAFT_73472 [Coniophora puteana RWD-64-598 SS2]|uniref:WD40 repeat-like protein n=1 Tax=Coniophora puteana (strain RWD-64-598) TaxID=741705 RepID=A0A5M3MNW0_CONPW|nr:uncharacterized protein CONPUDRAFT_73472 [Coniophora puteana RWD-64-598 SS2]EIW80321.1 hypothetical protein CONPUDRAFT_73472 [Coniophora puteana RWD-64-598 SS2]